MPYNPYIFFQNSPFPYINPINWNELVKKLKCGMLCVHLYDKYLLEGKHSIPDISEKHLLLSSPELKS